MTRSRLKVGRAGELLAADRLTALGYEIVEMNYRTRAGEIDIVARRGPVWVFVEVRTRRSAEFGTPEESLTIRKRQHLLAACQHYLVEHSLVDVDWRVDLVAIELSARGDLQRLEVIENAVQG